MTETLGGALLQLRLFRRAPANLLLFVVIPFFSAIFLSAARYRGVSLLTARPVLAPALMGMWMVAVVVAEMVTSYERLSGTLEMIIAAPARFTGAVTGRVLTVALLGLVTVIESLAVARVGFGAPVTIYHPAVFALALLATAIAASGTATVLIAVFLAFQTVQLYVNTLGYPFYILSGLLAPTTFLPAWIRPVGDIIYLHWSADTLYASMSRAAVPDPGWSLLVIVALGLGTYAAGAMLIRIVIDRLRNSGEVGLT